MSKTRREVNVTLRAETTVRIAVWVDEGDDATDLTPEEMRTAINLADVRARWDVESVREVTP